MAELSFRPIFRAVTLAELLCSDLIADSLVGLAGDDVFVEEVVFVSIGAARDNFAGGGSIDAGKIEELAFGSGVEIEKRVLAVLPTVANAFGGGARLVGSFVSGFAELSASVFDSGLGALGGFGDFVACSFVAGALVGVIGVASGGGEDERARKTETEIFENAESQHGVVLRLGYATRYRGLCLTAERFGPRKAQALRD